MACVDALLVELELAPLVYVVVAGLFFVDFLVRPKPPIDLHAPGAPSGPAPPLGKAELLALAP